MAPGVWYKGTYYTPDQLAVAEQARAESPVNRDGSLRDIRGEELRLTGARFVWPPVTAEDREIDASLETARDAIENALAYTDTMEPEGEMLLSQILTLIRRAQQARG